MKDNALENRVKANARKLEKQDLSGHTGKFVAFDGNTIAEAEDFASAIRVGEKQFGKDSGFVVRQIGRQPVLSCLVRG